MSGYRLALVFLATHIGLVAPEQCYRCFGSDWCSNPSDPSFASKASVINCPATALQTEEAFEDILIGKLLHIWPHNESQVLSTWGCVTATIHEDHEVHTVRTCLNNAAIICPTVQSVILNPDTNDVPEGLVLDCEGCVGELCNDHQFVEPDDDSTGATSITASETSSQAPETTTTSTGTSTSTSVTSTISPETTTPSGPLQCYRCFGGNWCNDVNDPDFHANALISDCPASSFSHHEYSGDSAAIARFLDSLDKASSNASFLDASVQSTWGCVTATIHEAHEIHTVRTCLNNAAIICPTVQSVILNPDVNDVPSDVVLDCDGCQGHLCNDHVFVDPDASSPSSGTSSSTITTSTTTPVTSPETTTPSGPLQCYRCFGGNWCNDVNDPDFQTNAMIIDCPASSFAHLQYSGDNLAIANFLDNLGKASSNASFSMDASLHSTWGCVTATIHEAHEIHTVRTCLNNAAIICPTVQSVILNPDVNDVPSDVVLDCDGCQGHLCNDHVFIDPSATSPSSGTSSSTSTTTPVPSPETTTPSGPLQCYRCFGGNWCNDVNDPDFQSNAMIIDCPASSLFTHHEYDGDSLAIATFLDNLDKASNASSSILSTWGCVTATIHEAHEIHTVRTCLNNAAIICPTVQSVILNPDVNDVPSDVVLDCDGCQGHLCNDHVFVDPDASPPSSGTSTSTSTTSTTTPVPSPETTTPSGPLQCYRCFGGNWCNDVNDPNFQSNAMIIDCPASSFDHYEYSGDNPAIAQFLHHIDKASSNASSSMDASLHSTWGCVTATIHEAHEIHTVRTCLNNAAIICPTVQSVILNPEVNDVPSDVELDCGGCQGHLCNDHVFVDPSATSPSSGTSSSTSVTSSTTPETTTPSGPLQCYRCFGGNWCNDVNDPNFQTNAMIIDCPATSFSHHDYSGNSLAIANFLNNLDKASSNSSSLSTWGCVTATIHEAHEIHTVRTCLNNAAIICPTVQSVILNPDVNDVPSDVVLDCDGCQGHLCNDHVFIDPSASSPSSTSSTTSTISPEITTPSGPLQCYRCFGGNWCNDVNDPNFQSNAMIIDCPASSFAHLEYSGDSVAIANFLDTLDKASSNASFSMDATLHSTWGCVTATIHEAHEIHTVRTCLNNAAIICPTVQSVILNPDINDVPSDVVLDCDGCQGHLCNDHVFVDPSASSPSTGTSSSTSSTTSPETTTPSGPLQCYRCFGGNWCNNVNDPDFQSNAMIIDCPVSSLAHHDYNGNSPAVATLLDNLHLLSSNTSNQVGRSTWGCVTATIHEAHEVHTVRTCLNNAATICPTVQSVILNPGVNDIPSDVVLDCQGCVGSLCNDHIFVELEETTTTSSSETTSTTVSSSSSQTSTNPPPSTDASTITPSQDTTSSSTSSSETPSTSSATTSSSAETPSTTPTPSSAPTSSPTEVTDGTETSTTDKPDNTSYGRSLSAPIAMLGLATILLMV